MITFDNITKRFGPKTAVDHASFTVNNGEIFGFLGPNGAGKTTTIKMLVGLLNIDEGFIRIDGQDIREHPMDAKRKICYVPDNPDIYEKMSAMQYLNFIANVYDIPKDLRAQRIAALSQQFEIESELPNRIGGFSHGMRQKICLIGALLPDPDILVLDEPMVGLDPKSSFHLKELMRERCSRGKIVFFSTHVMEVAEKLCHRIGIINHGTLVTVGTLDEIRASAGEGDSLEQLFLELTE